MQHTKQRGRKGVRSKATGDAARSAAMAAVASQARAFPDLELDALDVDGLAPLDRAFAHAIYDTVIRRWLTLRFLLERALDMPFAKLEPHVCAALLCGTAQIILMDKVPAHASVNEAVNWARLNASHRSGGLVNAVLRKMASLVDEDAPRRERATDRRDELPLADGTAVALRSDLLPEDTTERLAVTTSHPASLIASWSKATSLDRAITTALHGLCKPPVILNTAYATGPIPDTAIPHTLTGHHVFTGDASSLRDLLAGRDDLWVQDPASSLAAESVVDLEPSVVVDVCAGKGTKTRQLARTFPNAEIVATDTDAGRHRDLRAAFEGSDQVRVIPFDERLEHAGRADLVLLDVPCSNTGVLARRVEAKYRVSRKRTEELVGMQRQIVADAIPLLRSDGRNAGRILYSTCSLDPRENEEVAQWAVRWHRFRGAREHRRVPEGVPGDPPERYSDGSYALVLS